MASKRTPQFSRSNFLQMDPPSPRDPAFAVDAFAGRVIGITGAAHGIGEATARALTAMGAAVILIDMHEKNLSHVESELVKGGHRCVCVVGDISRDAVLKKAIDRGVKKFGRIDGWVNNAMLNPGGTVDVLDPEQFKKAWHVNVRAPWISAKLLKPIMAPLGGGSIVNISSNMAYFSENNQTAYTSSKAGMNGLTRAMAVELAEQNIRVNTIMPGYIATAFPHDLVRWGYTEEVALSSTEASLLHHSLTQPTRHPGRPIHVANAIAFLLSDASSFITGTSLLVEGGYTIELRSLVDTRRTEGREKYLQACEVNRQLIAKSKKNQQSRKR